MSSFIKVDYVVHGTTWHIKKALTELVNKEIMSFDIETKGVYAKEQRKQALKLLETEVDIDTRKLASMVGHNSGLSYPSLVYVTHFIFGLSSSKSVIFITQHAHEELMLWNWIYEFEGKLLIHNTLFDLKVMYHRIQKLPRNYDDTALLAKTLINHVNVWKAKIGLKDLMGAYYDPKWVLFDSYEPENLKDPNFLDYAAIDGGATFKLWELLQEEIL